METTIAERRMVVPARTGLGVRVAAGRRFSVVDLDGGQVGDVFAFTADMREHLSAAHTRAATSRLFPAIGQHFVTDRRRPILTLVSDTSPGRHDMLIPACDPERYAGLGAEPGHPSCAENLRRGLGELGLATSVVPQPVNVFMRIPVDGDELRWLPAASRPGDAITFAAVTDCVIVVSACPQDLVDINGDGPTPLAIDLLPLSPDLDLDLDLD